MSDYQFQYLPLTGKLSGKSMIDQTERAINELAEIVNEGSAQVDVITNLANTANDNAAEALEKAQQALDTTGRVYINESSAVDIDDYYDSQLLYIEDSTSTHLPVADNGFLEVKTNDTKTACEQLFTADTDGQLYFRSGVITASTVGDVVVYSVEYSDWAFYSTSAYVQAELEDYAELTDLDDYLQLSGGTITGNLNISGTITANVGLPPVGSVTAFAGNTTPNGWLLCDGSNVSRTTYAALFAVIGTRYGSGNGSTTFGLPNLVDKFIQGSATSGTVKAAGLPNITGDFTIRGLGTGGTSVLYPHGLISSIETSTWTGAGMTQTSSTTEGKIVNFNASNSNAIYGNSTTVQPPALTMRYIIKY